MNILLIIIPVALILFKLITSRSDINGVLAECGYESYFGGSMGDVAGLIFTKR